MSCHPLLPLDPHVSSRWRFQGAWIRPLPNSPPHSVSKVKKARTRERKKRIKRRKWKRKRRKKRKNANQERGWPCWAATLDWAGVWWAELERGSTAKGLITIYMPRWMLSVHVTSGLNVKRRVWTSGESLKKFRYLNCTFKVHGPRWHTGKSQWT